jgi:hypothetical protein
MNGISSKGVAVFFPRLDNHFVKQLHFTIKVFIEGTFTNPCCLGYLLHSGIVVTPTGKDFYRRHKYPFFFIYAFSDNIFHNKIPLLLKSILSRADLGLSPGQLKISPGLLDSLKL